MTFENYNFLGFNNWFIQHLKNHDNNKFTLARIISQSRGWYTVKTDKLEIEMEVSGKMIFLGATKEHFPAVGDWVFVELLNNDSYGLIHEILPRKTALKRKTSGEKFDYQIIASNIDYAFVVQGLDNDFNLKRLQRYLVIINECGIKPIILLSKTDKISEKKLSKRIQQIKDSAENTTIIPYSALTENGLSEIESIIKPYVTVCFVGSSGAGKTTLLNKLLKEERFETGKVREKDSKGKHTTRKRQLVILPNGGLVIDTPGMRELGIFDIKKGLEETFNKVNQFAKNCKFRNCSHEFEPECAIQNAIQEGVLEKEDFENYMKIKTEDNQYKTSYVEKKKKDKKLSKLIKKTTKNKKKQRY